MKIKIIQENKEVALNIEMLWKKSNTNLSKICDKYDLSYTKIYQRLHSEEIDLEWLKSFVAIINPKAKFKFKYHLTIMLDDQIIINQKSK